MKLETTIKEAIENIRKNGVKQSTGALLRFDYEYDEYNVIKSKKIVSACAMGQLGLNMGLDEYTIENVEELMSKVKIKIWRLPLVVRDGFADGGETPITFTALVENINDRLGWDYNRIADRLTEWFADRLDEKVSYEFDEGSV